MRIVMRFVFLLILFPKDVISQLEVSTGYAVNRRLADGAPIHFAYEFKAGKWLFTKAQVGYKYLFHFNDFVGAKIRVSIWEYHQTISCELVKKNKYIFKPNIGANYRYYVWKGKMVEPLNTLPERQYVIGFRNYDMVLNSFGNNYSAKYRVGNWGFTIQLQNQFKITEKMWLHITPFLEPDYDRVQNTGGCYIGMIFKKPD